MASEKYEIRLYICDGNGNAKSSRRLIATDDVAQAQIAYDTAAIVVSCAAKSRLLQVTWLEYGRAIKGANQNG